MPCYFSNFVRVTLWLNSIMVRVTVARARVTLRDATKTPILRLKSSHQISLSLISGPGAIQVLPCAFIFYLYLFNGPGREDVIGQVGCLRPVVKKKLFMINIKLDVAIKVMI